MNYPPLLHDFKVLLPRYQRSQEQGCAWLAAAHARAEATSLGRAEAVHEWLPRMERLIRRFGCSSEHIEHRRSELEDFVHTEWERMLIFDLHANASGQGIETRSRFYAETANRALADFFLNEDTPPSDLVHVTCTGYASPSAIQRLIAAKGWGESTRATQVYHMGCYAAVPALRVAGGLLAVRQSGAPPRVEVVHTELCTLHFNPRDHSPEQLVVQSLFADGLIRYALTPGEGWPASASGFAVLAVREEVVPDSLADMTWVLSEWGFKMTLSREVPTKVAARLPDFLRRMLGDAGADYAAVKAGACFAVHPGGPRILDSVQSLLELADAQMTHSRAVLSARGNMSSATLPHIWALLADAPEVAPGTLIISLAFGPGLTIAGGVFRKH